MLYFGLSIVASLLFQVCICYTPRECYKKGDCGPNECCVLNMERYSIPECKPKGRAGDWCRSGAEPEDRMLYYPNEEIRHVEDVYTLFCPCDGNLVCSSNKCTQKEAFAKAFAGANPVFTKPSSQAFAKSGSQTIENSGSQASVRSGSSRAFSKAGSSQAFGKK